jgi:hypothetical protein
MNMDDSWMIARCQCLLTGSLAVKRLRQCRPELIDEVPSDAVGTWAARPQEKSPQQMSY